MLIDSFYVLTSTRSLYSPPVSYAYFVNYYILQSDKGLVSRVHSI